MQSRQIKFCSVLGALIYGSGLSSVYALTETDFTNTGVVISSPTQFENDNSNNSSLVLVKPKGLVVTKSADDSALSIPTAAGDVITYTITLDNIGLLDLNNVQLTDTIIASTDVTLTNGDLNNDNVLSGDEIWEYTGTYVITQDDLDSFGGGDGDIDNVVVVTTDELDPETAQAEVAITQNPSFTVSKTVDQNTIASPGTLSYSIAITNDGNLSLNGISVQDTLPDGSVGTVTGPATDLGAQGTLDVGETWEYVISYAVTQADIDSGAPLLNTVSVTSTETGPTAIADDAETIIESKPSIKLSKSVDQVEIATPQALNYTLELVNDGNVTLTNVQLSDTLPNGGTATLAGPIGDANTIGALDVGESWSYSVSYTATQAEIDSGLDLTNNASVTADEIAPDSETATATTSIAQNPNLTIEKVVDTASLSAPGTLNYEITLSNTGNVSLSNVSPIDTLPDGTQASLVGPLTDTGTVGLLDVGEVWTYTTSYAVSQSEIDAGTTRTNLVEVTTAETGPDGFSATAITTIVREPAFTVNKTVDQATISTPGTLNYQIIVENTGNTSLTDLALNDTLPDGSVAVLAGPATDTGAPDVLDVGETWIYVTSFSVAQTDIDAGQILTNNVEVSTLEAGTQSADVSTSIAQAPAITISKSTAASIYTKPGDVIEYTLVVVNTGNVILSNIEVADNNADANSLSCDQSTPFTLAPGEQSLCSVQRTVTADDVQSTSILNQATTTATDPNSQELAAQSEEVVVNLDKIPPVATDNSFESTLSAVAVTLPGAVDDSDANTDLDVSSASFIDANATDSDGDGDLDTLVVPGEGSWVFDGASGEVTFTPQPGFTADPTSVEYEVSDATGLKSNPATLSIDYPQSAPVAKDDYKSNPQVESPSNPTTLNVVADNGSGPDSDPENDIDLSTVTLLAADATDSDGDGDNDLLIVPGEGSWAVDNLTADIEFTPESGFLSDPTPVQYTISDINGLVSNVALITIDYPQTAPLAVDDIKLDQPLGQPVALNIVQNDSDPESNLDPTTVLLIDPDTGLGVTTLVVPDQGEWQVDATTGIVTFTPLPYYIEDPTPVQYTVKDTTGLESNPALITVSFEEPAALEGIVWLDSNRNGQIDPDEDKKSGWTLRVYDEAGVLIATTVTDENGYYKIEGLIPGVFTVRFYNESDVFIDSQTTNGPILSDQIVNLPLPVDPGGVVYDSISRESVAGVTLNLVNAAGDLVDEACLAANQQSQITNDDGLYAFDLVPGAHATCPTSGLYEIQVADVPAAYHPNFSSIIRQQGAANCGDATLGCSISSTFDSDQLESNCTIDTISNSNACEVQGQADAPDTTQNTQYYVAFEIESGDSNVIFNHIPIDSRENDAAILLSKRANKKTVSPGGLVEYVIFAENTKDVPAVDITLVDVPPANFSLVDDSVRLIRAGVDGEFETEDDLVSNITVFDDSPITIADIDLLPFEMVRLAYVMKVGVGVVSGNYLNSASATGPGGLASNQVATEVQVVPDPVLGQATLVGKVFHDWDQDGVQDSATATGLALRSDHYGWNSLYLPDLPGRSSVNDNPADDAIVVNMPISKSNRFKVVTQEGTRISVDENGTITEAHIGDKARGLNSQDLRVCSRFTRATPTHRNGRRVDSDEKEDVLEIVISNHGINEVGIPGVRLASVTGLLVETDAYGRYSIPDVSAGETDIGSNFVLKVDPATLPQGAKFTTRNPYVLRILNHSLNKINFGVIVPTEDNFVKHAIPQCNNESEPAAATIANKLKNFGGGQILIEAHTDSDASYQYNIKLAHQRANTIRRILQEALGDKLMESIKVEIKKEAHQEADR